MCLLEGRGWQYTQSELKIKFWPTYKVVTGACVEVDVLLFISLSLPLHLHLLPSLQTDWQIWPAAQVGRQKLIVCMQVCVNLISGLPHASNYECPPLKYSTTCTEHALPLSIYMYMYMYMYMQSKL